MGTVEKLIQKILQDAAISYDMAERVLFRLGFELTIQSSHHVFRKPGYARTVSLKKRSRLHAYQVRLLVEVLNDHGYE